MIGDVQGHDVRAAGLMGQLRIALRAYASEGHRPDAVLARASHFFHGLATAEDDPGDLRFATCYYAEVDPATGTVESARAGHLDPVVRMADGTALILATAGGLPLGIDPDTDYPTTRLALEPGDTLMLCTDGLVETGGHDLQSGWHRLRVILEEHVGGLEELADALVQAVHGPPRTTPSARWPTAGRTTSRCCCCAGRAKAAAAANPPRPGRRCAARC